MPKNQKIFWEEVNALSATATCGYITGNASFTCDGTVMPHISAIVEASVYPSACPSTITLCDCIKTEQARSRNLQLSFVKDSSLGICKAFLKN